MSDRSVPPSLAASPPPPAAARLTSPRHLVGFLAALLAGCATSAPTLPAARGGGSPGPAVAAYADSLMALPSAALSGADRSWLDLYREAAARPAASPVRAVHRVGVTAGTNAYFAGTTYVLGHSLFIEQGAGVGVRASVDVTSELTAFVSAGRAQIFTADAGVGTIGLTTVDLGVRVDPPGRASAFNPYMQLALTLQTAAADAPPTGLGAPAGASRRLSARGGGLTIGGGVLVALVPHLALDLSADVTLGRLRALAPAGEGEPECFCSRSARLGVGLVFRP